MKQLLSLILCLSLLSTYSCQGQVSSKAGASIAATNEPHKSDTLVYKIRATQSEQPVLIVLMHGYGANEEDLFSLASYFPENYMVVSLRAPMPLGNGRYQWFSIMQQNNSSAAQQAEELSHSEQLLVASIESLQEKYKIPAERTFVGGFSQGGIMSYQAGLNKPDRIQGIFVLSGRMLPYIKDSKDKAAASSLNIWIAHGTADQVIPFREAAEAENWLKQRTYKVIFKEYKGLSHSINGEEINDVLHFIKEHSGKQ